MKFDFYNEIAEGYDELYREEQFRKYSLVSNFFGERILDIGCGTGLLLQYLLSLKNISVYVGIDISKNLINIARKKFKNIKFAKFILSDATTFDYLSLNLEFDTIVSFTALHNMQNIDFLKNLPYAKCYIFSLLIKSERFNMIEKIILRNFVILKEICDLHDKILICRKEIR
ncbi:MAG: class I SAM-dependent methyltransferase [Candidatus Woesearchaeota archaeon]